MASQKRQSIWRDSSAVCCLGEQHDLRNKIMHVDWGKVEESAVQSAKPDLQSANTSEGLSLKCKNCTLEEAAVLHIVQNILRLPRRKLLQK